LQVRNNYEKHVIVYYIIKIRVHGLSPPPLTTTDQRLPPPPHFDLPYPKRTYTIHRRNFGGLLHARDEGGRMRAAHWKNHIGTGTHVSPFGQVSSHAMSVACDDFSSFTSPTRYLCGRYSLFERNENITK